MRSPIARLLVLALSLAWLPVPAHAGQLNTADLFGTWAGKWKDTTFGTGGEFVLVWDHLGAGGALVTWHLSGNFFGCGEVGPVSGGLERSGPNAITKHAIRFGGFDDTFGQAHGKSIGNTFKFRGKNACHGAGPKTYHSSGKLVGKDFTSTMHAKVDGGTAVLTFTLHKFL